MVRKKTVDSKPVPSAKAKKENSRITLTLAIFLCIIIVVIVTGYIIRSRMLAVMINGVAISRLDIFNQLEKTQGKQILESLIVKELINQEAKKRNIEIGAKEIDEEIERINNQFISQGQSLEDMIAAQGLTMNDVRNEIRLQKILEKLLSDNIVITDEEIVSFIEQNKDYLPESTDEAALKDQVREQLKSQKLSTEAQTFIEELKKNATIEYFGTYFNPSPTPDVQVEE